MIPPRYALANGVIHTGSQTLDNGFVLVADGRVVGVGTGDLPTDWPVVELAGRHCAPGFVDLQVNGCGGVLFNADISADAIDRMRATWLRFGVTSLLPTLISCPDADIRQALDLIAAYRRTSPATAWAVPGLHLEGPYLSPLRPGIHPPAQLRVPAPALLEDIVTAGPEVVRLITAAPEVLGTEWTARLDRRGVRVAAGHCETTRAQMTASADAGLRLVTHLFNAMPPLRSREPGPIAAAWLDSRLMAGVIADGAHVDWANIRLSSLLMRERLFLVTDAMPPAGSEQETFELCGQTIHSAAGRLTDAGGTLAGSLLTMDQAVRNCVQHAGISLDDALRMSSLNPARALGLDSELGLIAPGRLANLVVFDAGVRVQGVVTGGAFRAVADGWNPGPDVRARV